jgi:hypothetical protein
MASPEPSEQQDVPDIIASQRAPRVTPSETSGATKARLLPGGEVDVLNVSETGLLVEGKSRPVVGTIVSIQLKGSRLRKLDGKIVRSRVSTIHRDGTLSYESAIEFDHSHALQDLVSGGSEDADMTAAPGEPGAPKSSEDDVYIIDADNDW